MRSPAATRDHATASKSPVLEGQWLEGGTHLSGIGSNAANKRELDGTAFGRSTIVVDFRDQTFRKRAMCRTRSRPKRSSAARFKQSSAK
jgi:ornithine cyclodeaminase/alanine dehydrogenase-like protein (mu-crystallin family)